MQILNLNYANAKQISELTGYVVSLEDVNQMILEDNLSSELRVLVTAEDRWAFLAEEELEKFLYAFLVILES